MEKLETLKSELWKERNEFQFDDKGIEESIRHALKDFTFRTTKKKTEEKFGVEEMFQALAKGENGFVCRFKNYFRDTSKKDFDNLHKDISKEDFDKWHKDTCKVFLKALEGIYEELSYGKAQKIVNMTFKYAYCLLDDEEKKKYFEHCHMPLDSFTLEWFKRKIVKNSTISIREEKNQAGLVPKWSNIRSEDDWTDAEKSEVKSGGKIPYCYEEIIKAVRDYFDREDRDDYLQKGYTVLESEFYIWKYMQLELAVENMWNFFEKWDHSGESMNKKDREVFKNKSIHDKLNYLHEKFSDVEWMY